MHKAQPDFRGEKSKSSCALSVNWVPWVRIRAIMKRLFQLDDSSIILIHIIHLIQDGGVDVTGWGFGYSRTIIPLFTRSLCGIWKVGPDREICMFSFRQLRHFCSRYLVSCVVSLDSFYLSYCSFNLWTMEEELLLLAQTINGVFNDDQDDDDGTMLMQLLQPILEEAPHHGDTRNKPSGK